MSIYQFSTEAGTEYILMPASVRLYFVSCIFCHTSLTPDKRAENRQRLAPAHSPAMPVLSKAVAHRRISTASLVGDREEVSLSPGKDRRALSCHRQLHALRVSLVSFIAPPHARSLSRGTVPVIRIFVCQGAPLAPLYVFNARAQAAFAAFRSFLFP